MFSMYVNIESKGYGASLLVPLMVVSQSYQTHPSSLRKPVSLRGNFPICYFPS